MLNIFRHGRIVDVDDEREEGEGGKNESSYFRRLTNKFRRNLLRLRVGCCGMIRMSWQKEMLGKKSDDG